MAFDADAFRAARRPWTLTIGGTTYTAVPISTQVILDFKAAVEGANASEAQATAAVRALLRRMFPPRVHYRWRGDPVAHLMAQDAATVRAALEDFFVHLAGQSRPAPATTGTASSS